MYDDTHVQYKKVMEVISELLIDIFSEDEDKLKVILGTVLYDDPVVQEVLFALEHPDEVEDSAYWTRFYVNTVMESLLDCYFEAMFNESIYSVVDVQNFRFCGSDLIDMMLEAFGVIGQEDYA